MSDILIKGMKMPKERPVCIVIDVAGQARRYDLNNDRYADDKLFEAVSVSVHGRLINAKYVRDTIIQEWMDKADDSHMYKRGMEDAYEVIRNAPTIIEAEEGET